MKELKAVIKPVSERRQHPRLEKNIPLKISSTDFDIVTETKNLSCRGAYCQVNRPLEMMTKLKIHILIPLMKNNKVATKKITCEGVVVRAEPQPRQGYYNTAIYFSDIQSKDAKIISEYVQSILKQ